jgi:hypothetical protein
VGMTPSEYRKKSAWIHVDGIFKSFLILKYNHSHQLFFKTTNNQF